MNGTLVDVYGNDSNAGASCPACGQPINPLTGDMWHTFQDFALTNGGLQIERTYNSYPGLFPAKPANLFGSNWSTRYDVRVRLTDLIFTDGKRKCWKADYHEWLDCEVPSSPRNIFQITRPDGKAFSFEAVSGSFVPKEKTSDSLSAVFNGPIITSFQYRAGDGTLTEHFAADGRLTAIVGLDGRRQVLSYADGIVAVGVDQPLCQPAQPTPQDSRALQCITDEHGRQLKFEYDALGRVSKVIDTLGQSWLYEYDGPSGGCIPANATTWACKANNLTRVVKPNGTSETYYYNEASRINNGSACYQRPRLGNGFGSLMNAMTGVVDDAGVRILNWTYDCYGRATMSELAGGVERVNLSYTGTTSSATMRTTVKHTTGPMNVTSPPESSRYYDGKYVQGKAVFNGFVNDISPCAECGAIKAFTYDVAGNVASATDFNGTVTTFEYDLARKLQVKRVEGHGTSKARATTTEWHPDLRLPIRIASPKLITTISYDNGLVISRTLQATDDASGASGFAAATVGLPRTWTYAYNEHGQILAETGPRTDVLQQTVYAYDSNGNLSTVTNPAGHVTTYDNYDGAGRPGRIAAANGVVTTITYSPLGWVTSQTTAAGGINTTTTYDYDTRGHLKKVTLPDGTFVTYSYDVAYRLIGVTDSVGNKVEYTLDYRGNRIAEKTSDPNGMLARQITRVFNVAQRLQQVTGGAQ